MENRIAELEKMVPTLHFALTMLWIEKFKQEANPVEAAENYIKYIEELFGELPTDLPSGVTAEMAAGVFERQIAFFDHVHFQMLQATGAKRS